MSRNLDGTDWTYSDCIEITYRDLHAGDLIYNGLQVIPITEIRLTGSDTASWMNYRTPRTGRQWNQENASRSVRVIRQEAAA